MQVVVAFQKSSEKADSFTHLQCYPALAKRRGESARAREGANTACREIGLGRLHSRWKRVWDCSEPAVFLLVDRVTNRDPSWTIFLTGHSVGGALATIAADAFA